MSVLAPIQSQISGELHRLNLGIRTPSAGSEDDQPPWWEWPPWQQQILHWVLRGYGAAVQLYQPEEHNISSMARLGVQNDLRGGARHSRHLYTGPNRWGERGEPWGAGDFQWDTPAMQRLRADAHNAPNQIRDLTGWPGGVGLIVYGLRTAHLDFREFPDFVDLQD